MGTQGISRQSAGFSAPLAPLSPASRPAKLRGNGQGETTAPKKAPERPQDVAPEDWNDLMSALTARLRLLGGTGPGPGSQVSSAVLECADALAQLHATLRHEVGRRRRLELELFDARVELAMSRAELAGTRDGERQARYEALHDALTALPNRKHFRDRLQQALAPSGARRPALAVFYIDLDDFKPINDLHGHATGDELLRIIAARLARAVRAEDLVARLGGDEFACLIANLPSPAQLDALARKLYEIVAAPVKLGRVELTVHPSIGIAVCPPQIADADALLRRADAAMYRAKRLRLGHARFDDQIDDPDHASVPSTQF